MARNIVKAKLDIIFKKLFTDEGNQHLLQAYLSDTLGIPYDSIENRCTQFRDNAGQHSREIQPYGYSYESQRQTDKR